MRSGLIGELYSDELILPQNFSEQIKKRLQDAIIDLIPGEKWDNLINTQVKNFIEKDLPNLINEIAREKFKEILKKEFASSEWQGQWQLAGKDGASKAVMEVMEVIKQNGDEIIQSFFSGITQRIVEQMRYSI